MPPRELVLSNSRSNTFRRCQRQYGFKYVQKLKVRELALPLFRGDWLHQCLMTHYDGQNWRERHEYLKARNWDNLLDEEREELGGNLPEEVERLMKGYLAHWKEADKRLTVVDTELNETIELPDGQKVILIIDLIVEEKGQGLWIFDHKTVSRFYPLDFMLLDSQLALYFYGATILGYKNLQGAVLNELITKPPTKPKFLEKSQMFERRRNLHSDAYSYFALLKETDQDPRKYAEFLRFLRSRHDEWWRRTRMPRDRAMVDHVVNEMMATGEDITRTLKRKTLTRTARKECQFDCSYLELCMAELQGLDLDPIISMKYQISQRPPELEELKRLWPKPLEK